MTDFWQACWLFIIPICKICKSVWLCYLQNSHIWIKQYNVVSYSSWITIVFVWCQVRKVLSCLLVMLLMVGCYRLIGLHCLSIFTTVHCSYIKWWIVSMILAVFDVGMALSSFWPGPSRLGRITTPIASPGTTTTPRFHSYRTCITKYNAERQTYIRRNKEAGVTYNTTHSRCKPNIMRFVSIWLTCRVTATKHPLMHDAKVVSEAAIWPTTVLLAVVLTLIKILTATIRRRRRRMHKSKFTDVIVVESSTARRRARVAAAAASTTPECITAKDVVTIAIFILHI